MKYEDAIYAYNKAVTFDGKDDKAILLCKITELYILINKEFKVKESIVRAELYSKTKEERFIISSLQLIVTNLVNEDDY